MVQFITHFTEKFSYLDSVELALDGGCRWIQLRMKNAEEKELISVATKAKIMCQKYRATFIIDDHVELAKRLGADGVHLGKNDMPIAEARNILGKDFIIGGTANTFTDVKKIYEQGVDYIGCGPFRFTTTKKNLSPILGLDGYAYIVKQMQAEGINLPIIAIGGIEVNDVPMLMRTGVTGIAVSGSVLRAKEPVDEMKKLITITKKTVKTE